MSKKGYVLLGTAIVALSALYFARTTTSNEPIYGPCFSDPVAEMSSADDNCLKSIGNFSNEEAEKLVVAAETAGIDYQKIPATYYGPKGIRALPGYSEFKVHYAHGQELWDSYCKLYPSESICKSIKK